MQGKDFLRGYVTFAGGAVCFGQNGPRVFFGIGALWRWVLARLYLFNAMVANGNTVRIPANVVDYLPGFPERLLRIRHPGLGKQPAGQAGRHHK